MRRVRQPPARLAGNLAMRVLVVGATGFIGRHVVARLTEAGHEVAAFHRGKSLSPQHPGITEILGDRATLGEYRSQFRAWCPQVVVDMILSSAQQARSSLDTFRDIAQPVLAVSSGDVYPQWPCSTGLTMVRWYQCR